MKYTFRFRQSVILRADQSSISISANENKISEKLLNSWMTQRDKIFSMRSQNELSRSQYFRKTPTQKVEEDLREEFMLIPPSSLLELKKTARLKSVKYGFIGAKFNEQWAICFSIENGWDFEARDPPPSEVEVLNTLLSAISISNQ